MSTTTKNISTNSFGFPPSEVSNPQTTCYLCQRLLYSFEEILVCRVCHGAYHWRCVKPETISHYGENAHFLCDKCNDTSTTTNPSPTHRLSNGGIKIKSSDSTETDYRNFASIPSKLNTTPTKDTTVVNAIRYFEEKQQQQQQTTPTNKSSKLNELDGHLALQTNGQYTDDSKAIRRIQQQSGLETDEENTTAGMFQADYQYTPLKEYAATKNVRTTNDTNTNGYQKSPSPNSEQQLSSRYDGGIRYTNKSRLVESSLNNSSPFTIPTADNLSVHNRERHFISSTNLNVHDNLSRRHQSQANDPRNPLNYSTPYLSQIRDDSSPTFKPSYQQQHTDRHSNVGSDSGIVMTNFNHPHQITDDNQVIERKLTDLVQQLGRQLEIDAHKLGEKLELKLKNLEHMIHQQTYIIRRQDEVIERLKSKILKIETERDHFRERLSIHEQREYDEKKYYTSTDTETSTHRKLFEQDDQQQTLNDFPAPRKFSNASSSANTEHSRPSTKKTPAPRVDYHGSLVHHETEPSISTLIKTIPGNQERPVSDFSAPSIATKLLLSVPLLEKPAAASRLDDIIHQSNTNNIIEPPSSYYNLAEVHHHDSKQHIEHVSMEQQQIVANIHHDDESIKNSDRKSKRSTSSSSSSSARSSSSASTSTHPHKYNLSSTNTTALPPHNPNLHRSLESIPRKTSQTEGILKPTNKTVSLEFGTRPVGYDDPGSIYITPQEAAHPASQYQDTMKGWLRKQNRDSFFKRIERYYCVISNNMLLMHKHEHDTRPQKAVNLRGAKVVYYEDQKHGPSLELTWSRRSHALKRYHLYTSNAQEAQQWLTGIETAIQNLEPKNKWQQYRMQT